MGCSASKPGPHEPQCCCPCCGCCITLPKQAVLYDDPIEHGPTKTDTVGNPSGQDDAHQTDRAISSLQPARGTVAPGVAIKEGYNGLHDSHQGQDLAAAGHGYSSPDAGLLASDTDTAHSSVPLATATTTLPEVDPPPPSGASGRWGMPSTLPPIPVLNFCMSMGMNARSLKTLRAHLKAKGFSMHPSAVAGAPSAQQQPSPQPSAHPDPPQAPSAHRWHSLQPMHSGHTSLATPAGDPIPTSPRHPSDLASTSWMGWHDASSQVGLPSPGGSGSDVASDDVWRDVIAEDSSEGEGSSTSSIHAYADGHRSEGHRSDSSEDSKSSATFKSAASLGPRSHRRYSGSFPRPPQLDTTGASITSQPHSGRKHTPGSRGPTPGSRGPGGSGGRNQSWEASVHIAQASIAADDLAHPQGGSTHPALDAFRAGRLSFAFSGGGFFFPYHLGCVIALKDMGIITDATPLAGASCGSIIIACVNSGLDLHKLVDRLLEFAEDCRTWGTAGRLRDVIVTFMTANLPSDAHMRCRGRTFISLTKVFPYLHPYIISDYTSKEDLVDAIATSCHIPAYCDGSFMARFRSHWFVDGGLVRHIPALPKEAGAAYVAGVSCVPFKFLESLPGVSRLQLLHSLAVSPDMFGAFPFGWHEVGGLVLAPAADPVLLQMVEMGKRDVTAWAHAVGLIAHLASTRRVATPLTSPTEGGAARASGDERQRGRHKHRQRSSRVRTGTPMISPLDNSSGSALSQPGGLPASVEDDWHDAVEDQTLISPSLPLPHTTSSNDTSSFVTGATVLSPAASQEGTSASDHAGHLPRLGRRGSMEATADDAMREGLAAAAGAVAGPLHMDAHQAIDALAGTSTLGMAQAAAVAAEGRDHAADRQLQVLRVTGGTYRPGSMAATAVPPVSPNEALLPVPAVMKPQLLQGQHVLPDDGMPVTGVNGQGVALAGSQASLPPALGVLQDASAVQAYRLDIDIDSSAWGGRGGTGTGAAAVAGSGEATAAGPHTVQVTARIAGQPVVLELRLHMPADARAAV